MNWIPILRLLPRNAISQAFGVVARARVPIFSAAFRDWFVRQFQIDMSDAAKPQAEYRNVHELFIRELRAGARPMASEELTSPVDGKLSQWGTLDQPNLGMIQAKQREYTLDRLIRNSELAERFRGGIFAVIYLAPFNYHRIHSPIAGALESALYCPGTLWPVNRNSVEQIDELFCVNERVTSHILADLGGEVLVVKVGATNVGRISLAYTDAILTNSSKVPSRSDPLCTWRPSHPIHLQKGSPLGAFELGSTVVLVCSKEIRARHPDLFRNLIGQNVRLGQSLI
jgi:phosphatidylserine decarboxylase